MSNLPALFTMREIVLPNPPGWLEVIGISLTCQPVRIKTKHCPDLPVNPLVLDPWPARLDYRPVDYRRTFWLTACPIQGELILWLHIYYIYLAIKIIVSVCMFCASALLVGKSWCSSSVKNVPMQSQKPDSRILEPSPQGLISSKSLYN